MIAPPSMNECRSDVLTDTRHNQPTKFISMQPCLAEGSPDTHVRVGSTNYIPFSFVGLEHGTSLAELHEPTYFVSRFICAGAKGISPQLLLRSAQTQLATLTFDSPNAPLMSIMVLLVPC